VVKSQDGGAAIEVSATFLERIERLQLEGAYDQSRGATVPWDEAAARVKLDSILWAALQTSLAGAPPPGGELLAAVDRHVDPDGLSPPQRDMFRDVRASFDAGHLDGMDSGGRMGSAYHALSWIAGIEDFDRWLDKYKQDGLYGRPNNTPWADVAEVEKVHAIVGMAQREKPPGDYALAAIEREVDYASLPEGRREALESLRSRIDAGELEGHQPRDLADRANYALRLAEFEQRIEDYKRDGDPWQGEARISWESLPEVRKLDLIVQESGSQHLHFEPRTHEIIDREVDLSRVPEGRRRGIENTREMTRLGPEEYRRRQEAPYVPPDEASAAFKERIENGLWTTCFTDGERVFADWSDLTAEAKLFHLAEVMDWEHVPESYFRTVVERELKTEDLPADKRAALENPKDNRRVFAVGFDDGIGGPGAGPDGDQTGTMVRSPGQEARETMIRELFDTSNRVAFAEMLEKQALDPGIALRPASEVRDIWFHHAETTWESFQDVCHFRSGEEIKEALDEFKAKEAALGGEAPKTLMDHLQAGGFFHDAGARGTALEGDPPQLRSTTRNLVDSIFLDVWPRTAAIVDFGIESQEHYESLYYPVREGEITAEQLDAAMGKGDVLTALARSAPSNPHKDIVYSACQYFERPDADDGLAPSGERSRAGSADILSQARVTAGEPGEAQENGPDNDPEIERRR
jgi:hypothetical protein